MATDGHRLLPRTSCAQKSKRCICCARTAPPGAHVALVFVLMEGACSGVRGYPLVGGLLSSEGEEQAVAADSVAKLLGKQAAEEKLPCPKHRPLPPIDPVEGLSWLDHVKAAPLPCFNELNLGCVHVRITRSLRRCLYFMRGLLCSLRVHTHGAGGKRSWMRTRQSWCG
mmetsp:Transcript_5823/g.13552  ORF Transcript_5823/g.13552 Transcript_5823/m.13552 type:complete len:169 (+) Transcript_5823:167-673(+)